MHTQAKNERPYEAGAKPHPKQGSKRQAKRWKTLALSAVLAGGGWFAAVPAEQAHAQSFYQSAYAKTTTDKSQFTTKVVYLVNLERRKAGLKPLVVDARTAGASRVKAADMSNRGYFDHTSPTYGSPFNLLKLKQVSYRAAGENIALGQRSPEAVMQSWMKSAGHRSNILNPNFTSIGVGYYNGHWVQLFIG